ncbi:MAG: TetR/AcrR family transcriptional regulator [Armatimonadaceae bacterium]
MITNPAPADTGSRDTGNSSREARGEGNDTERRLLDCALTLFAEKGYAGTSVRDIIEAVGMTRPVLYYYARNKEDLFRRVVEESHREAYTGMAALLEQPLPCAERLRSVLRGTFAFCASDPRIPRLMFQAYLGAPGEETARIVASHAAFRFGVIAQIMREGIAAGEVIGGDAESLALIFCCLMDQHVQVLSQLPHPQTRLTPELADALLDVFLHGVGTGERVPVHLPPFAAYP